VATNWPSGCDTGRQGHQVIYLRRPSLQHSDSAANGVGACRRLLNIDAWLFQQPRLVNARAKTLLPALAQRQALADHLVRLLDKLQVMPEHAPSVGQVIIQIPDNGRDRHLAVGAG